jgi:hypothetical protein
LTPLSHSSLRSMTALPHVAGVARGRDTEPQSVASDPATQRKEEEEDDEEGEEDPGAGASQTPFLAVTHVSLSSLIPQSEVSVPGRHEHVARSQTPSLEKRQESLKEGRESDCGRSVREPQSWQSEPHTQVDPVLLMPPSSHAPLIGVSHSSLHDVTEVNLEN